jgi:protoheme IX farnesyltransferase
MNKTPGYNIKSFLKLSKLKIMIPVSLTGFTGYFIFDPRLSVNLFFTSLGILLLAISASVLNQIQEVEVDKKMKRTQNRPIPAGKIDLKHATVFFFINLITGVVLIYTLGNPKAALIGLITIFWYNGIYTYFKKITAFAVVPGAVTGALPPLIGWVAAGGGIWDRQIVFLEFLFFMGQIPHFWLLILKYGEEYKKAGIPTLKEVFNIRQINRLTFIWVIASIIAAIFLCYFNVIQNKIIILILITGSLFIIWQFIDLLKLQQQNNSFRRYSLSLDLYFLLVLLLLISDRILV